MTFSNKSLLSFFLTSLLLSGSSMAMKEEELEEFNQKSIVTHQKNLPTGVPVGSIIAFAGDKEPSGWLMCDGLQYSSKKYPKLYEIIKTKCVPKEVRLNILDHNENNENKLFCVPDLRGRVLVGVDNGSNRVTSNNTLGATGGEEKHQLTIEEMPKHNHAIGEQFDIFSGDHATVCQINKRNRPPYISEDTGGNQTHNNMQPYLVSNYIIKAKQDEIVHEEKEIKLFKPLKAILKNNPLENNVIDSWTPYDNVNAGAWKPMRFDAFEGDEFMKVEDLSGIKIPENGVYSLFSHYCWHSIAKNNEGKTAAYTSISINEPSEGFKSYHFAQHHLVDTYVANDCLNRVTYLNKGDRVMLSIKDHPNTEYSKSKFQLKIERIY